MQIPQDNTEIESEPLLVLFGEVKDQRLKRLARSAFEKYSYPVFVLSFMVTEKNILAKTTGKVQIEGFATLQARAFKDLVAVLLEARGLGVAEKLIDNLREPALLQGKRFIHLEVAVGNAGAIVFTICTTQMRAKGSLSNINIFRLPAKTFQGLPAMARVK